MEAVLVAGERVLGTVSNMPSVDPCTQELESELQQRYAPIAGFAASLRNALGCEADAAVDPDDTEVLAYLIRPSRELVTSWLLTSSAFVVHEFARNGNNLTVAVPLWRVRRVVESKIDDVRSVTVEIDADRAMISANGLYAPPSDAWQDGEQGAGGLGRFELTGQLRPALYEAVAESDAEWRRIQRFARTARAVIVG